MGKPRQRTAVVLFTRDLRLHDHPALTAAVERAERVVPLFVLDDRVLAAFGAPNRVAFLLDSLDDLDAGLRDGGRPSSCGAATCSRRPFAWRRTPAPRPSSSAKT
jgi:deoxyribodipyrimidine photolyase